MVEETDWAYLAGLIDGEGYLDVNLRDCPCHKRTKRGYAREFKVWIQNGSLEMLKATQESIGGLGSIGKHHWDPITTTHNVDGYSLRFSHNNIRLILPKIMPYLKLKQKTAKIMLESLTLITTMPNSRLRELTLLLADERFREECHKTPGNKYKLTRKDDALRAKAIIDNSK